MEEEREANQFERPGTASPHCSRRTTLLAGAAPTSTIGAYIGARQRQERIFILVYARSDWAR